MDNVREEDRAAHIQAHEASLDAQDAQELEAQMFQMAQELESLKESLAKEKARNRELAKHRRDAYTTPVTIGTFSKDGTNLILPRDLDIRMAQDTICGQEIPIAWVPVPLWPYFRKEEKSGFTNYLLGRVNVRASRATAIIRDPTTDRKIRCALTAFCTVQAATRNNLPDSTGEVLSRINEGEARAASRVALSYDFDPSSVEPTANALTYARDPDTGLPFGKPTQGEGEEAWSPTDSLTQKANGTTRDHDWANAPTPSPAPPFEVAD